MKITSAALRAHEKGNPNLVTYGANKIYCCAVTARSAMQNNKPIVTATRSEENESLIARDTLNCSPPRNTRRTHPDADNEFSFEQRVIAAPACCVSTPLEQITSAHARSAPVAVCLFAAECGVRCAVAGANEVSARPPICVRAGSPSRVCALSLSRVIAPPRNSGNAPPPWPPRVLRVHAAYLPRV